MALRGVRRRVKALEQHSDAQLKIVLVNPRDDGRYSANGYVLDQENLQRLVEDHFRTTLFVGVPSKNSATQDVSRSLLSDLSPEDLRRENEEVRSMAGKPTPYELRCEELTENLRGLLDDPGYLRAVSTRVRAGACPEKTNELMQTVEQGLAEGIAFSLRLREWVGVHLDSWDRICEEVEDAVIDWFLRMAEAHPWALDDFISGVQWLRAQRHEEEAVRLVLAADKSESLLWDTGIYSLASSAPFLLDLCRARPAETKALRQRLGTDIMLRHLPELSDQGLDFDVDLIEVE